MLPDRNGAAAASGRAPTVLRRRLLPTSAARLLSGLSLSARRPLLAATANSRKAAHFRPRPPPNRRLSRVALACAGDPLRSARIGRRHDARTRRRLIDRTGRDGRRRRIGAQRRDIRGIADTAGIGQRSRIRWAERHAGNRGIAGAGRACGRRQLRKRAGGSDQNKSYEKKCSTAEHRGASGGLPATIMWRARSPLPGLFRSWSSKTVVFTSSSLLGSRRRRENQT